MSVILTLLTIIAWAVVGWLSGVYTALAVASLFYKSLRRTPLNLRHLAALFAAAAWLVARAVTP